MANNSNAVPPQTMTIAKPVQKRGAAMMVRGIVLLVLGLVLTLIFNAISGVTGVTVVFYGLIGAGAILFIVGLIRWLVGR